MKRKPENWLLQNHSTYWKMVCCIESRRTNTVCYSIQIIEEGTISCCTRSFQVIWERPKSMVSLADNIGGRWCARTSPNGVKRLICASWRPGRAVKPLLTPIPVAGPFDRVGVDVISFPKSQCGHSYAPLTTWPNDQKFFQWQIRLLWSLLDCWWLRSSLSTVNHLNYCQIVEVLSSPYLCLKSIASWASRSSIRLLTILKPMDRLRGSTVHSQTCWPRQLRQEGRTGMTVCHTYFHLSCKPSGVYWRVAVLLVIWTGPSAPHWWSFVPSERTSWDWHGGLHQWNCSQNVRSLETGSEECWKSSELPEATTWQTRKTYHFPVRSASICVHACCRSG